MSLTAFDSHVIAELKSKLSHEIAERGRTVLDGTIKDMEDYRRVVGMCHGLQRALEIIEAIENRSHGSPQPKAHIRNIG